MRIGHSRGDTATYDLSHEVFSGPKIPHERAAKKSMPMKMLKTIDSARSSEYQPRKGTEQSEQYIPVSKEERSPEQYVPVSKDEEYVPVSKESKRPTSPPNRYETIQKGPSPPSIIHSFE